MTRYGNYLKKLQAGIPWEIHPNFCSPKISAEFKGTTQVVDFCCKIHSESLVIHLCLAKILGVLPFFFNSGEQNELNISEFSNSSVDSPQIFELLLCFWKLQCLGDSSWRGFWHKQLHKCTMPVTVRGTGTAQPFFQKGHRTTALGQLSRHHWYFHDEVF